MNAQVMSGPIVAPSVEAKQSRTAATAEKHKRSYAQMIFILALIFLLLVATMRLLDPATLPIRHVRIQGNFQHLSTEKMQAIVSEVIDGGFFNLNVMAINDALLDEPWVDWVVVKRIWPDALNVHVKEQAAVAHWNEKSLLNESATVFTPENASTIDGIPYLAGPDGMEYTVFTRYGQLRKALTGFARINEVSLSDRRAWTIQFENGPLVILGRNDAGSRITRLTESVLPNLKGEIENVRQIDLRYTNGFAIQWRNNLNNSIVSEQE